MIIIIIINIIIIIGFSFLYCITDSSISSLFWCLCRILENKKSVVFIFQYISIFILSDVGTV